MCISAPGARGLSVLVVEDVADTADSLAILLKLHGHTVCVARTGPEALALAPAFSPDVMFLDIGMPDMDGWELTRRLRQIPFAKRPLFVAVTGYGQPDDIRRSNAAGIDLHLTKPVDPEQILGVLDRFARVIVPVAG